MGPWVCPVPCCGGFIGALQLLTITAAHLKPGFLELGLPPWKRQGSPGHVALTIGGQAEAAAELMAGSKGSPSSIF